MNRIRRIDHWQEVVDGIVRDYKRLNTACDAALNAGALDSEGPFFDAIWRSFEGLLARLDVDGWISWFVYENQCGKKGLEAKGCGKKGQRPIKTSRHLAVLIVESEENTDH
jgi:hypothetical protein